MTVTGQSLEIFIVSFQGGNYIDSHSDLHIDYGCLPYTLRITSLIDNSDKD